MAAIPDGTADRLGRPGLLRRWRSAAVCGSLQALCSVPWTLPPAWCRRALVLLWLIHLPGRLPAAQTCCAPRDTGGCEDVPGCEACVCAFDDFCCDLEWDDTCAEAAAVDCGELCQCELPPTPTPGASDDCCSEHPEPGCGLPSCEDCLCSGDDYCCTVEWDDLCLDDVFDFCIDECQCLAVSTPTPTPTPPLSPSATADASPSSTPGAVSPTAEPTSSATAAPPTGTPVGTSTNAVPSATETPKGVASVTATAGTVPEDEVRYPRGDADCDAQLGADDVTATILALGGATGCGNDDCNRDGDVGSDDIECVARCVFDACPVSPAAPVVLDVESEIAFDPRLGLSHSYHRLGLGFGGLATDGRDRRTARVDRRGDGRRNPRCASAPRRRAGGSGGEPRRCRKPSLPARGVGPGGDRQHRYLRRDHGAARRGFDTHCRPRIERGVWRRCERGRRGRRGAAFGDRSLGRPNRGGAVAGRPGNARRARRELRGARATAPAARRPRGSRGYECGALGNRRRDPGRPGRCPDHPHRRRRRPDGRVGPVDTGGIGARLRKRAHQWSPARSQPSRCGH